MLFNYIIRNTPFNGSRSTTSWAIIPKNIPAYKVMNFTASASLIWTRDHFVHVFSVFRIREDPVNGGYWMSGSSLNDFLFLQNNKIWQGVGALPQSLSRIQSTPTVIKSQQNANMTIQKSFHLVGFESPQQHFITYFCICIGHIEKSAK